jgi:hypothetical protein
VQFHQLLPKKRSANISSSSTEMTFNGNDAGLFKMEY